MLKNRVIKYLIIITLLIAGSYGIGRLYYKVTDGFAISNITSDLSYDEGRNTRPLTSSEKELVDQVLQQEFHYLGKGCQSYVFESQDGQYVMKFFKYQRFRTQPWLPYLTFLPGMDEYYQAKIAKKSGQLRKLLQSWKIAFDHLKDETGLVYVHLNKDPLSDKMITIYDKMGFKHTLFIDQMEFMIQRKAKMYCSSISDCMAYGDIFAASQLVEQLLARLLSEYQRGLADGDHAIMQNTGVLDGKLIHIDVGQFALKEEIKDPEVYKQDLFNKTYKFRKWLALNYPELNSYLEIRLYEIIGNAFDTMEPYFMPHNEK